MQKKKFIIFVNFIPSKMISSRINSFFRLHILRIEFFHPIKFYKTRSWFHINRKVFAQKKKVKEKNN